MSETARIAEQIRRGYQGEAWHGPSLRELLEGVTAGKAAAHPIAGAHSIWELVLHVTAWEKYVRRRMSGERIVDVAEVDDWPPVTDASDAAWRAALHELERSNHELVEAVKAFPDSRLGEKPAGKGHTFYVDLHGIVQHDLYHAGQVALLKKM